MALPSASESAAGSSLNTAEFESLRRGVLESNSPETPRASPPGPNAALDALSQANSNSAVAAQTDWAQVSQDRTSQHTVRIPRGDAPPKLVKFDSSPVFSRRPADASQPQLRPYHSMMEEFDGGDTQPMTSQDFATVVKRLSDGDVLAQFTKGTSFVPPENATQEGDPGYVNLTHGLGPFTQIDGSPERQFLVPVTPAAGQKSDNRGQDVNSMTTPATVTPGGFLQNLLGATPDGVSLTQMFNATQGGPSQSAPDEIRSDPVFGRPSPQIDFMSETGHLNGNTSPTSPLAPLAPLVQSPSSPVISSPTKITTSDLPRPTSEPKGIYTTMKESQERREAQKRAQEQQSRAHEDDGFSEDDLPKLAGRKRRNSEIMKRLESEMRAIEAPRSSGSERPHSRRSHPTRSRDERPGEQPPTRRSSRSVKASLANELNEAENSVSKAVEISSDSGISDDISDVDVACDKKSRERRYQRVVKGSQANFRKQIPGTQESSEGSRKRQKVLKGPSRSTFVPLSLSQQDTEDYAHATQHSGIPDSQPQLQDLEAADANRKMGSSKASQSARNTETGLHSQVPDSTEHPDPGSPEKQQFSPVYYTSSIQPPRLLDESQPSMCVEPIHDVPSSPPRLQNEDRRNSNDGNNNEATQLPYEARKYASALNEVKGVARQTTDESSLPQPNEQAPTGHQHDRHRSIIPETDELEELNRDGASALQNDTGASTSATSVRNADEPCTKETGSVSFNTAETHHSRPGPEERHETIPNISASPLRRMRDIADEASQDIQPSAMEFNEDFFPTKDDDLYRQAMSSPQSPHPRKRLKTYSRSRTLKEPATAPNKLPKAPLQRHEPPSEKMESENNTVDDKDQDGAGAYANSALLRRSKQSAQRHGEVDDTPLSKRTTEAPTHREIAETPQEPKQVSIPIGASDEHDMWRPETPPHRAPALRSARQSDKTTSDVTSEALHTVTETQFQQILDQPGETEVQFPNKVFAVFKDTKNHYYPGTCIGKATTAEADFKIRFDDGSVDDLPANRVKTLLLEVGDVVKVDKQGLRSNTYSVVGFKDQITDDNVEGENSFLLTDVFGHMTMLLKVKPAKRQSTSNSSAPTKIFDVALSDIYLPHQLFIDLGDRAFADFVTSNDIAKQSDCVSSPITSTTTPQRSHRKSYLAPDEEVQGGDKKLASRKSPTPTNKSGIFSNMVFCVSFPNTNGEVLKRSATEIIRENGGDLLDDGFHKLFPKTLHEPPDNEYDVSQLRLASKTLERHYGFTALISDKHCKSVKYFQALALSIPCLHHRWLTDSVTAGRPLPWSRYLLPAGESAVLGDAVRSRILPPPYVAEGVKLTDVVNNRQKLLQGGNVLFVNAATRGKKTAKDDKRKQHLFLTYALGAEKVRLVKGLDEAREVLDSNDGWDWVFVVEDAAKAKAKLFPSEMGKGKKRKRGEGQDVRVVDETFVKQSLILGELLEE